jgi:hypothetical protein
MEGVKETWVLVDRKSGKGMGITVFETEDDLRRGDEALNAMSRPGAAGAGQRTGVTHYEVALHKTR